MVHTSTPHLGAEAASLHSEFYRVTASLGEQTNQINYSMKHSTKILVKILSDLDLKTIHQNKLNSSYKVTFFGTL